MFKSSQVLKINQNVLRQFLVEIVFNKFLPKAAKI